jgi:Tfp pilus assembly protein PilF
MVPSPPPPFAPTPLARGGSVGRLALLLGVALVLAAWVLSARVAGFDFLALGDDDINVTLNPHLGHLTGARWAWLMTDVSYVRRYMPFGWLSLCALFQVNGLDPFVYHGAAFAFYVVNVVLVYAVALRAIRLFVPGAAGGLTPWQAWAAVLAAGWWAFHPLRVESTAWISGLLYGQAATFFLVALGAYLRSFAAPARRLAWVAIALVALTASLMTYPIALGFPLLLFAVDLAVARRPGGSPVSFRRLAVEKLAFLAPVGAIALSTTYARMRNPAIWGSVPTFADFPFADRVMQAAYIVAYYVWRPLYPLRLPPITPDLLGFDPGSPVFVLSAALVLVVTAWALASRRSTPWVGPLWLAYLATALPFIGFTEHPYNANDRYAYLPTVVWAAALAAGLALLRSRPGRVAASVLMLGLIAVLGVTTDRTLGIWSSPRSMYAYLVSSIPEGEEHDRILSRYALFDYLYGDTAGARAKIDRCLRDFPASEEMLKVRAAIEGTSDRLAPKGERRPIAFMHYQMGLLFLRSHQAAEARAQLERALRLEPELFPADFDLAVLDATDGRPREALHHCLLAEAHAGPGLSPAKRTACLGLIEEAARAAGDRGLAQALATRLRREPASN